MQEKWSVAELKAIRETLRQSRTVLAVNGGLLPAVYAERLESLNLRIEALSRAIWHLENPGL